jgi:hypothetical protein
LVHAYKTLASILDENEAVAPILKNLSSMYIGTDYKPDMTKRTGKVEINQIDMVRFDYHIYPFIDYLFNFCIAFKEIVSPLHEKFAPKIERKSPFKTHGKDAIWPILEGILLLLRFIKNLFWIFRALD